MDSTSRSAGIVLCGGQSRRMGRAKSDLPFGSDTLLQRVVRTLRDTLEQVVVVHGSDQALPHLGDRVSTVADSISFGGPLMGLLTGLEHIHRLPNEVDHVYLTSCDAPFLTAAFVHEVLSLLAGHDVAVPVDDQYFFPLAAAYRVELLARVRELVEQGERRPRALFDVCDTRRIPTHSLTHVDAELKSLINLNTPKDYKAALVAESLPIPDWLQD